MQTRLFLACAVAALACRPDPGTPNYPDPSPFIDTDDEDKLPGDTPWDGTTKRLSLSVFYEGGATDTILVDDESVHYYIYEGSFTQQTTNERVEGYVSDRLTVSSSAFWGGGIHFDQARDLRGWGTLHAAVRSSSPAMEAFAFGMVGSAGEGRAPIASYGFVADDEWHVVRIPLADIAGQVGLDAVTVGLLLISPTAVPGTALLIDDLYFTDWEGS
jgi:hypothetical protein